MYASSIATITKLAFLMFDVEGPAYILAARAGIHPTILSNYRLGKRPIPPHHLQRLAEVLEVEPEDILGYVEWDPSSLEER